MAVHFPFRRASATAWAIRLPQLDRGKDREPPVSLPVAPSARSLALALSTRPPATPPRVAVPDVVADPPAAERLPSASLVAAVIACDAENRALRARLHARKRELHYLRAAADAQAAEDAEIRARLAALEEVIAALHANLNDLRLQRDHLLAAR